MGLRAPNALQQRLTSLQEEVPGQLRTAASQGQSSRDLAIQQTVAAAPASALSTQQIQQTAAALNTQTAQQQIDATQRAQSQLLETEKLQAQQEQQKAEARIRDQKLGIARKNQELQQRLAQRNEAIKQELFDKQSQFQQDELGRTLWNERQLLDWQVTKAKDAADLRKWEQEVSNMHDKRMSLLKASQAKIKQALENGYMDNEQKLNQEQTRKLVEAKVALEKKIAEEKAEAAANAAMFEGIGTVVGMAVGVAITVASGGTGAAAIGGGAALGGSLGKGLGSMVAAKQ